MELGIDDLAGLGSHLRDAAHGACLAGAALHERRGVGLGLSRGLAAIAVLADWVRHGTEQVAEHAGGAIGSLLNVSFGNAAEPVLALLVLASAHTEIVQAQITGSIIGTTLLFLRISALVGGMKRRRQTFSQERVGLLSTLLMLVAIAILLPAVFDLTERVLSPHANRGDLDERLSLAVSVVRLLLYAAHLIYVFVTHRSIFTSGAEPGAAEWSRRTGILVMLGSTLVIAAEFCVRQPARSVLHRQRRLYRAGHRRGAKPPCMRASCSSASMC
jgi:calcium/proton exchanger cax